MLVLFAVSVATLLGMVGLVFSAGLLLQGHRRAQSAADAAALRATWQVIAEGQRVTAPIASSDGAVRQALLAYTTDNGAPAPTVSAVYVDATGACAADDGTPVCARAVVGGQASGLVPPAARGARVTAQVPVNAVLPGFTGAAQTMSSAAVAAATARAIALPGAVSDTGGRASPVVPVTVPLATFPTGAGAFDTTPPAFYPNLFAGVSDNRVGQSGLVVPVLDYLSARNTGMPSPGAFDYSLMPPAPPASGQGAVTIQDLQYWSDSNPAHQSVPLQFGACVAIVDPSAIDAPSSTQAVTTGLQDNIRAQSGRTSPLPDDAAVITVSVWDTRCEGVSPSWNGVHIAGFARIRVRWRDITTPAPIVVAGGFGIYSAAAAPVVAAPGGVGLPTNDVGMRAVRLIP